MFEAFVYCWTDHKTNKLYVGSHKGSLVDGYVCSSKLMKEQYIIRPQDFSRQIIAEGTYEECLVLETKILKIVNAKINENFYNLHNGDGKFYNKTHLEETKRKIGKANAVSLLGKKQSEETKQKHRCWKHTEETKQKMRERAKGNKYALGYKHTKEALEKMKVNSTGRKHTKESKEKIGLNRVGVARTKECKQKISKSLLGNQCHAKKYVLITPTGKGIEVFNLRKFCENKQWPYKYVSKRLRSGLNYLGYSMKKRHEDTKNTFQRT